MAYNTWDKIQARMNQLKPWHTRMDTTKDLVYMKDFEMMDFKNTHKLDNVINVTGNHPAVFANAIISDLLTAKWQTVVEGDISDRQAHEIEKFIEDNFEQADEALLNKFGMSSLYDWLCNHVAVRGPIGVRWLSQVVGDEYVVDCLPVDMRWVAYWYGKGGLTKVAPIFFRDRDEILEEFPSAKLRQESDVEVREYWDENVHEIWVARGRVEEEKNSLGYPPFVIVVPSSGFMLRDKGYLEHEGEDILFLNRKIYKEINRSLSVEQTLGMNILKPGLEREVDDFDSGPAQPAAKTGEIQNIPRGERALPVPTGDMTKSSFTAREDLYRMRELGDISDAELGSATLDRPGVWFAKQFEIRQKLERSRLNALALMKEGLARMMIKQTIESTGEADNILVGRTGRKDRFTVKSLGDPDKYRISFRSMVSSKEQEIVNLASAQAAMGIMPRSLIIRDILKAENPEEWEKELSLEQARSANPALALLEMAVRYAQEAASVPDVNDAELKKMQSKILLHDYVLAMRQRVQPQEETAGSNGNVMPGAKSNLQGLVSMPKLLGAGGLVGKQ